MDTVDTDDPNHLFALVVAADLVQLPELVRFCERALVGHLADDPDAAAACLEFATVYEFCTRLKRAASDVLDTLHPDRLDRAAAEEGPDLPVGLSGSSSSSPSPPSPNRSSRLQVGGLPTRARTLTFQRGRGGPCRERRRVRAGTVRASPACSQHLCPDGRLSRSCRLLSSSRECRQERDVNCNIITNVDLSRVVIVLHEEGDEPRVFFCLKRERESVVREEAVVTLVG